MFIESKPSRRRLSSTQESDKTRSDSKMRKASPMKIGNFRSLSCHDVDDYNEKTASRHYDAKTWEMYHRIVTSRRRGSFNEQVGNRNDSKKQGILKKRQNDRTMQLTSLLIVQRLSSTKFYPKQFSTWNSESRPPISQDLEH